MSNMAATTSFSSQASKRRPRQLQAGAMLRACILISLLSIQFNISLGFTPQIPSSRQTTRHSVDRILPLHKPSSTSLSVWWYGGSESTEAAAKDADSCELVPVRIEKPTSSSRKIFGEIVSPDTLDNVWSILTDYDRLAIHVPNLKESKITARNSGGSSGDGQYKCRLFQRGAQKIIGFEFGATVTMDMKEMVVSETERRITFKCVDSMFFSEFDGEWKVEERVGINGEVETLLSYVVVVRPNGPVPVAALEWRIREDVPTNLRAVKLAASSVKAPSKLAAQSLQETVPDSNGKKSRPGSKLLDSVKKSVNWYQDETMAAYLTD